MNSKKARKRIVLLWFIVSIFLIILGININSNLIGAIIIGQLLTGIGMLLTFSNFLGWIVTDFGLAVLVYPISKILGNNITFQNSIKEIAIAFLAVVALQLFLDDSLRNKKAKKRCTVPFQAKCVSFEQGKDFKYNPVYKYNINGQAVMYRGNDKTSINPKLGEVITIFVNKKNNKEIYCPTPKAVLMVRYLLGTLLITFSLGAWLVL